jgi:two-component system, OmpR family, response regulator MprA
MASKLLVVDDDASLVSVLRLALTLEGYELVTSHDGEDALKLFSNEHPDLIVLDVALPNLDGFTVCERIRAVSDVPILMLTGRESVPDRVAGLEHGADDYLVKPFAVEELLARIGALLRRSSRQGAQEHILSFSDMTLDLDTHEVKRGDEQLNLTPREFELMATFLQNPRQVLSRDQLCREVWGYAFRGESNFIDVTIKDLRRKTEIGDKKRLIQTVRGFGYALRED